MPSHQNNKSNASRRIGEFLIHEGLISASQLDEALEYQCIYGGRLGTSLIELGLTDEAQLAKVLGQQLKLHVIKSEKLMLVPETTLRLIPDKVALKYQVVPYCEKGKKLYIAINDVSNLKLLDELSFQLNRIVVPLAVPEVRLMMALKKHYGMLLSPRFETLAAQIARRNRAAEKLTPEKRSQQSQKNRSAEQQGFEETASDTPWPLLGDETYDEDPCDATEDYYSAAQEEQSSPSVDILTLLANARDRDDIANALIQYFKSDFPTCGLFVVRETIATGWLSSGGSEQVPFEQFSIPVQEASILNEVIRQRRHYLGAVNEGPQNSRILAYFMSTAPQTAIAIPLMVQDRIVSILYVQAELNQLEQHFAEFHYIIGKAEMAFKLLILRNKILSSSKPI